MRYQQLVEKFKIEEEVIIVCHRCLVPLNPLSRYVGCNDEYARKVIGNSLLTDPYIYSKQIIN